MSRAEHAQRHSLLPGRGFTLVQMMVCVTILVGMATLGYPAFQSWIQRHRVEGFGQSLVGLMRLARSRAVSDSAPVVVRVDQSAAKIRVFLDRHGATPGSPSDGVFNPVDGVPASSTDQSLAEYPVPVGVSLVAPKSQPVVDGFTMVGRDRVAVFLPGGSIADCGAVRFGDEWANYLEVRVGPQATARVVLRKYVTRERGQGQGDWLDREAGPWPWYWGKSGQGPS